MTEGISENPGVPGTSGKIGMTEFREINALYLTLNKMLRKKKGGSVYTLTIESFNGT